MMPKATTKKTTRKKISKSAEPKATTPGDILDEVDAIDVDGIEAEVDATAPKPDTNSLDPDSFDAPDSFDNTHPDNNPLSADVTDIVDQLDAAELAKSKKRTGLTGNRRVEGASFVRMLNTTGHTTAIAARYVPFRLIDGYTFIEGEPCVPRGIAPKRSNGEREAENVPSAAYVDPNYEPSARSLAQVRRVVDAEKAWLVAMNRDRKDKRYATDPTLDWSAFVDLAADIKRRIARGKAF